MIMTSIISIVIIILTVLCLCILIHKCNNSKKQLQELEEEIQSKKQAEDTIEETLIYKRSQLSELFQKIEELVNNYVEKDKARIEVEQKLQNKKEELSSLNDIFTKNKQQLLEYQNNQQQLLENINEKFQKDFQNLVENYEEKAEIYENKIEDLREKRNAAIQVAIDDYENKNQRAFYMLQLKDDDIEDIKTLRKFEALLHNKEILGKLIYKTYIEKPYTDLIGRVLNKEEFSGIYKITNETNQMCYVGQAANIKKRWQQHIKRAVGAEPLVNNKLYPAMQQFGIENFSFEVIDRCGKDKLNEREQYWQNFYSAKSFGYSIK